MTTMDLTGAVVTADALHTQREPARWLVQTMQAGHQLPCESRG
ncbi:hypothetical protein [Micromonospora sp. NPDC006431]